MHSTTRRLCRLVLWLSLAAHAYAQAVDVPTTQTLPPRRTGRQLFSFSQLDTHLREPENLVAQNAATAPEPTTATPAATITPPPATPIINFTDVSITEFLRFVSRLTGKNFIFDPDELNFSVTIISESPASLEDVMAALLQNLRIHEFLLMEEGSNFIIYKNDSVRSPAPLLSSNPDADIATQVFQVFNVSTDRIASIIRTMTSTDAIVEVINETQRIVVTDFAEVLSRIADIVKRLDAPNSSYEIGQYVAINASPFALIRLAEQMVGPIAGDSTFLLIPHVSSNSIFIVSTPFLVDKTLSILQALDLNQAESGLFNLGQMKFNPELARAMREELLRREQQLEVPQPLTQEEINGLTPDEIHAMLRELGYSPEKIQGLSREEIENILRTHGITPSARRRIMGITRGVAATELPLGHVESTEFLIHRLQYRKSDDVASALRSIADSLIGPEKHPTGIGQSDLVVTLNSVQPIEESNSLVFTGSRASLQKVKELIAQIDVQVRQVFIEALILDTTINNSLNFGVQWAGKIQRRNAAYQTGLVTVDPTFTNAFNAIQMPNLTPTNPPTTMQPVPLEDGFNLSGLGRKIKFMGMGFRATGALIQALQVMDDTRIVLNPKVVTEHNVAAELFVGQQIPIKGQSIVNAGNTGNSIVSTNYNTVEVGVTLKVTPLIAASDTVTLIIEQKISTTSLAQVEAQGQTTAPPAIINETRAVTRIHMPSDYFLIMSGLVNEDKERHIEMIPCLGALPLVGIPFNTKTDEFDKRNIIIIMRPIILDTNVDIERVTQTHERLFDENVDTQTGLRGTMDVMREVLNLPYP